ncbi:putative DUF3168 family protein (plasmid) [Actinoalloteichus sp. GBA129-24]|nr:putative DUF3168 family protein [Actinoalloteichus sp. GBA129-24]APU24197.1 putative DUF3168 family protein [Actinoalloteichus sp. GBA129-24]
MTLPWIPGAIRALLLADPVFVEACPGGVTPRAPSDVTRPYATVQAAGNYQMDQSSTVFRPLIQIDGWCGGTSASPQPLAWRVAAEAARVLSTARNAAWGDLHFTARITDGPMELSPDVSRGPSLPVYRAVIRAELTVHVRISPV